MELQQPPRDRRPQYRGQRNCHHKHRVGSCAILSQKPVRQVNQHAGEETGLRQPQQETKPVELRGIPNEACQDRHQAPADHDPGDPLPGAPAFHQQRSGNFQQEVAGKEDTCPKPIDFIRETQLTRHLQTGDANVRSIQVRNEIEEAKIRQQTLCHPSSGGCVAQIGHGRDGSTVSPQPVPLASGPELRQDSIEQF